MRTDETALARERPPFGAYSAAWGPEVVRSREAQEVARTVRRSEEEQTDGPGSQRRKSTSPRRSNSRTNTIREVRAVESEL
ncbi:Nicastrin [Manis pentadactyla]|nr:Nicastrin [Manis pentadactyla]